MLMLPLFGRSAYPLPSPAKDWPVNSFVPVSRDYTQFGCS